MPHPQLVKNVVIQTLFDVMVTIISPWPSLAFKYTQTLL